MRSVAVIMPALNEEHNIDGAISSSLESLDHYGIPGQIVVINDGSRDGTQQRIDAWMARDARISKIVHASPHGIGASFWEGVQQAASDNVVLLPGDNENDPMEIFRYYSLLEHVDIVIPFLYNRNDRPLFRNVLSLLYRQIINTTFLINLNYTNGTVLYRRDLLLGLAKKSLGFFFQTDILVRLIRAGYLFAEVPYRIRKREHGKSKAVSFPSLWQVIKGYVQLVRDINFAPNVSGGFTQGSVTAQRKSSE